MKYISFLIIGKMIEPKRIKWFRTNLAITYKRRERLSQHRFLVNDNYQGIKQI